MSDRRDEAKALRGTNQIYAGANLCHLLEAETQTIVRLNYMLLVGSVVCRLYKTIGLKCGALKLFSSILFLCNLVH